MTSLTGLMAISNPASWKKRSFFKQSPSVCQITQYLTFCRTVRITPATASTYSHQYCSTNHNCTLRKTDCSRTEDI